MTQRQLGEKAGLTVQTISRLETGRHEPEQGSLERIAPALGATVFYLQHGVEAPRRDAVLQVPLDAYLRETSHLSDEQIETLSRVHQAMQAERQLAELRAKYEADVPGIVELEAIPGEPIAAHPEGPPEIEEWPPKEGEVE